MLNLAAEANELSKRALVTPVMVEVATCVSAAAGRNRRGAPYDEGARRAARVGPTAADVHRRLVKKSERESIIVTRTRWCDHDA